jgi:hypothetical protein
VKTFVNRCLILGASFLICSGTAFSQEAALESEPIASSAEELQLPSTRAFQLQPAPEQGPLSLRTATEWPAFIRDMTVKANVRSFYFAQQAGADDPGNDNEKISWALGGSLQVNSGKVADIFLIRSELFTSQRLYGPEDKDGAKLLEPGQDGYTVLGVANPRFEYEGHVLSLYRQRFDLPYVNNQDNRMTPNTFESYSYGYFGEGDAPPLQFGAGYMDKIKKRDSDEFVSMSEGAGVSEKERGMPWAGFRLRPSKDLKIVAVNFAGIDFLNMFYSDAEYSMKLTEDWQSKSSFQFSEQRSIGDDLLTGKDVSVGMFGFQQALSYGRFLMRAAVTVDDKGTTVRSPFGSYPGYNSGITEDFNRAGEIAWKFGISYDFAGLGLDGLSAYSDFISGNRAKDDNHQPLNDKNETDVNIDYRVKEGLLKNFWLRLRGGFVHEDTVGTTKDFRVIVNYEIPIV